MLLETDTPYDNLVQVMDHVRVFEQGEGANIVQAELFPDISMGDAPATDAAGAATRRTGRRSPPMRSNRARRMAEHHLRHRADAS